MNVLTVTGRIVDDPVHPDAQGGDGCAFRLSVDGLPWLQLTIRTTDQTVIPRDYAPGAGHQVTVVATVRHADWIVRDGIGPARWCAYASVIIVFDDGDDTVAGPPGCEN